MLMYFYSNLFVQFVFPYDFRVAYASFLHQMAPYSDVFMRASWCACL